MRSAPWLATLIGLAFGLALGACASKQQSAALGPTYKQEIADRWSEIRQWRVEMGLRTEPDHDRITQFRRRPLAELRLCPEHPAPETETCRDTCNIADAICDNAERICDLADELEGNSWAREKCESAKASCKEATERCCQCINGE